MTFYRSLHFSATYPHALQAAAFVTEQKIGKKIMYLQVFRTSQTQRQKQYKQQYSINNEQQRIERNEMSIRPSIDRLIDRNVFISSYLNMITLWEDTDPV